MKIQCTEEIYPQEIAMTLKYSSELKVLLPIQRNIFHDLFQLFLNASSNNKILTLFYTFFFETITPKNYLLIPL